jgi:hypothetical protein
MNDSQNNAFITGQTASYVDAYLPPDGDDTTSPAAVPAPPADPVVSGFAADPQFSVDPQFSNPPQFLSTPQEATEPQPSFDPFYQAPLEASAEPNQDFQTFDPQPTDAAPVSFAPPSEPFGSTPPGPGDAGNTGDAGDANGTNSDSPSQSAPVESLEEQNIFAMLGVENGTEAQKESFLDELQQVIWEDFLENDVELLISSEEYAQLQTMVKNRPTVDLEQQEKIVVFLEKIIPDLEEIMLEKALQLKGDMFRERIAGMREFYATNQAALATIDQAENSMNQSKWGSAAQLLNSLQQ